MSQRLVCKNSVFLVFTIFLGKSTSFFVSRFLNKYVSTTPSTNLAHSISTFIIWENIKPQHEPLVLMVFPWIVWYSNLMCHFATLRHNEENFQKTFNSALLDYMKCAQCIFSHEIVKEHTNHHEFASSLQTSFSCTKDALDKHIVPASRRKILCLQDTHFSQTK